MDLEQLEDSVSRAFLPISDAKVISQNVLRNCLESMSRALFECGVQSNHIGGMINNLNSIIINLQPQHNNCKIMRQAFFDELCKIFRSGRSSFSPKRRKKTVVLFVGLQGCGKTTSSAKYAYHYQKKGWNTAIVSTDKLRTTTFNLLNRYKDIPFYGCCMQSDPVKIAKDGVERFQKENRDLIVVDTCSRHAQQSALFEEMIQLFEATKPHHVILVIDGRIGPAAIFYQAQAFKQSVAAGAVILTNMDGPAMAAGALTAVAATKNPVIFIGTGELMDEFDVFDVKPFVSRLLGLANVYNVDEEPGFPKGDFTLRMMYKQFQENLRLSSLRQLLRRLTGISAEKMEQYMTMMDLMAKEELDSSKLKLTESRIMMIARGSDCQIRDVMQMLQEYRRRANIWRKMKYI